MLDPRERGSRCDRICDSISRFTFHPDLEGFFYSAITVSVKRMYNNAMIIRASLFRIGISGGVQSNEIDLFRWCVHYMCILAFAQRLRCAGV